MRACKMTGIQTLSGSKDHDVFDSLSDAVRFNYTACTCTINFTSQFGSLIERNEMNTIRNKITSPYGDYNNKHQHPAGQDRTVFTKHK